METFEYLTKHTDTSTTGRELKLVFSEPFLSRSTNTIRVLVSFGTRRLVLHLRRLLPLFAKPNLHTKL